MYLAEQTEGRTADRETLADPRDRWERTMLRSAWVLQSSASLIFSAAALATPVMAGMTQDLADCTATDKKSSAAACTRVLNSGRLWENQHYIGYYNRGWAYFNTGDYDKALTDFEKSAKLNAAHAETYYSRAIVQHMRGARDAALTDLDLYLEKKGEVAESHLNRARLLRSMKEPDRAFSELQSAAALDPGDHKVEILRALVLADLGELGPARTAADKAIESKPDDAASYYARAYVGRAEGKRDDAMADVEKALGKQEKFAAAHTLKGHLHEQSGERDAAVSSFRRATEGTAKSPDAITAQADARERLYALTGEHPPAEAKVAASEPAAAKKEKDADCRRFIPSAGTTVAVDCPD
jgi:tetratricopeptide (TPR) repeat protein